MIIAQVKSDNRVVTADECGIFLEGLVSKDVQFKINIGSEPKNILQRVKIGLTNSITMATLILSKIFTGTGTMTGDFVSIQLNE
jgi:hypothetical protein